MKKKKKSSSPFIPALPFFLLAPGARVRWLGHSRRIRDEHTHLRWAEQRYITRTPRDTSPAALSPSTFYLPLFLASSPTILLLCLCLSVHLFIQGVNEWCCYAMQQYTRYKRVNFKFQNIAVTKWCFGMNNEFQNDIQQGKQCGNSFSYHDTL